MKNNFKTYLFVIFGITIFLEVSLLLEYFVLEGYVKPLAYFTVGLVSLIPLLLLFFEKKSLLHKIMYVGIFFAYLNSLFEIVAIINKYWVFSGHYILTFNIFNYVFPIEELLFWILPSAIVFVILYEFFFDDNK